MESTFFGGAEQSLAKHFLGRVVGQLQIMHASVD